MSGDVLKSLLLMVHGLLFGAGNWMEAVLEVNLGLEKVGVRRW